MDTPTTIVTVVTVLCVTALAALGRLDPGLAALLIGGGGTAGLAVARSRGRS